MKSEHIERLNTEDQLISEEKELLIEILYQQKQCLVWNFSEVKRIDSEVFFFQNINTISHEA